jgi:hypothetical protein
MVADRILLFVFGVVGAVVVVLRSVVIFKVP